MLLCLFDENDVLVSYQEINNVPLDANYVHTIDINSGVYSVIAWTGLDHNHFDWAILNIGSTTKDDLLFHLKRSTNLAASIEGLKIYSGGSEPVFLPQATSSEPLYENVTVNLQEITNRVHISVEGLTKADDYEVEIESDNGAMNIDGSLAQDNLIQHTAEHIYRENIMESDFTLLKLDNNHKNVIVIKNKLNGTELYRGSLLEALILRNPNINLECDHDFTIHFKIDDPQEGATYAQVKIWVNDWLVHSYETEL